MQKNLRWILTLFPIVPMGRCLGFPLDAEPGTGWGPNLANKDLIMDIAMPVGQRIDSNINLYQLLQ